MNDETTERPLPRSRPLHATPRTGPSPSPASTCPRFPRAPSTSMWRAAASPRPIQGFGKMWQKTYQVRIPAERVSNTDLIATWKQRFPDFWPEGSSFYGPLTGIAPGDVALLNMTLPGKMKLSTGVMVLYADEESFTLMTPAGPHVRRLDHVQRHRGRRRYGRPGPGAHARQRPDLRDGADARRAQAGGPLLAADAHRRWPPTSTTRPRWTRRSSVSTRSASGRRWRNVWHSSAIRSTLYMLGAPGTGRQAPVQARSRGCLSARTTPSSSARARTGSPRRSCWPGPAAGSP